MRALGVWGDVRDWVSIGVNAGNFAQDYLPVVDSNCGKWRMAH